MKLTKEQERILFQIVQTIKTGPKDEVTLGGYAGTGKTVLVKYLKHFFPQFAVCAYTGKAANVLRKKGTSASTIHSLIYVPEIRDGEVEFVLNPDIECKGFLVDEGSMVPGEIYSDLRSFGMPTIFVGDHGQLEPVNSDFNLMQYPDFTLEEIHRNAGDIAHFAQHLRLGKSPRTFRGAQGTVKTVFKTAMNAKKLLAADQVICAFNKTRVDLNNQIRANKGLPDTLQVGERVMCLRNNQRQGLFNGMQGTVHRLYTSRRGRKYMDFEFDGQILSGIHYTEKQFGRESYDIQFGKDTPNPFDFAYAITCHKAQGDEWDKVLVVEQACRRWSHIRWSYTAASRAKGYLEWVLK